MAEVFAGHAIGDHGFQKPVAIKRLLPELASDHVFVERLIGEAKLLVGMQHGNIVSVLDLARDGDDVFLVMEFVDGPSLRQLLKSRGVRGLPLGVATYIIQASAAGLEFAHNRPGGAIIHADISPSNLLLTTSGEVRVADFGIARREGGGYGVVEGKWAYMAPEQARGEPLTARADVFALGVVLYELICGAHPFGRQVTAEERDSEPMRVIPPRVVKPSIPAGLDAICMRALAHDPRDRYKSMQQLIDAIVEERFANHWREGASDLAQAIRECSAHSSVISQPRTMVTDRPVTIITRSLIREITPHRRASSPRVESSVPHRTSAPRMDTPPPPHAFAAVEPSLAETRMIMVNDGAMDELARAAALLEIPPNLRADGTPMPPFRMSDAVAGQDLASVVGGGTMTGTQVAVEGRSSRWTIAVLGIAALVGAVAAVALQLRPSNVAPAKPDEPPAAVAAPIPAPAVEEAPPAPAPAPAPIPAPTVAPEPVPTPTVPQVNEAPGSGGAGREDPSGASNNEDAKEEPVPAPAEPAPAPPSGGARNPTRQVAVRKKEPGSLRVNTNPWAYASVGAQRCETPCTFKLPPGRHTVRLEYPNMGGIIESRTVTIESNKTTKLTLRKEDE